MNCTLMHKYMPVARLCLDDETGDILKIYEVFKTEHLPVGVGFQNEIADRAALNEWWTHRLIPSGRSGIHEAMNVLGIHETKALLTRCFGLSLSDQYWMMPSNRDIKWERINFFVNNFSDDIGDVLFGNCKKIQGFNFNSPDVTTGGGLKKRWKVINGRRYLIKGGSDPFKQQPFNEMIASLICDRLDIHHVDYAVVRSKNEPYSICKDFVDSQTELVSAFRVMKTLKKDNHTSVYRHYVNCCKTLGVNGIEKFLDRMIVLDYLLANEDRHLNNFGLLRNAGTLEWMGAAPIFDSGTSLGYNKLADQITNERNIKCKPFKRTHAEQLKLVTSFRWINFRRFDGIKDDMMQILSSDNANKFIDESRRKAIILSVMRRIDKLYQIAMSGKNTVVDDLKNDVTENISEEYMADWTYFY